MKPIPKILQLVLLPILLSIPAFASIPTTAKGMWIWQIWNCEGGNLDSIISKLKQTGVTWVAVKLGDSNSYYEGAGGTVYNWAYAYGGFTAVIDSFHSNGIKVYGWQYIYGTNKWSSSGSEAGVTNQILNIPGIDGFIIDAEVEFEASGMTTVAAQYLGTVRAAHPKSFVALTSFARVTGQPIPWTTFLSQCDANMPQAYWALRPTSVSSEFSAMWNDFESWEQTWISEGYISSIKPIVPIGCENSDGGTGYQMQYGDIQQFCNLCQNAGYVGTSLWEYSIMDSMNWRDYAASWQILPPKTPIVTGSYPSSGDTLQVYDSIRVNVNTSMDAASMDSAFSITPHVNGKLIMNPDFTEWTFAPDTLLSPSTHYTISLNASATSLLGVPLGSAYSLSFPTGSVDTSAPNVIAVSPRTGDFCASKAYVEFVLNQPVQLNSISSFITFMDSLGNKVPFTKDVYQITPGGYSIVAVRASHGLIPGMKYTVTLAPGISSYYDIPTKTPYSTTFLVSTSQSSGGSVIEGFESSIGAWEQPAAVSLTHGTNDTISNFNLQYKPYDGFNSGALSYGFDSLNATCAVENSQGFDISSSGSFGMWVFGDNSRNELDFIFGKSSNNTIAIDTIDWYGWKYIGMWRSKTDSSTSLFKGFAIKRLPGSLFCSGTIYIDDIQVNGRVTAAPPRSFALSQNYPNPFNPATIINYNLSAVSRVTLNVYDVLGRKVATLVDERQNPGTYSVVFDGSRFASGVYIYELRAGVYSMTKKMILVK